jgi:hypothetical protein
MPWWRRRGARAEADASTPSSELSQGQLDNRHLEKLVTGIVAREDWNREPEWLVVEIGTGGGKGSTVALHRALVAAGHHFQLIGYEGDGELAAQASEYWRHAPNVHVVHEYFMRREDLELAVRPRIAPSDRKTYLPVFDAAAQAQNFLSTEPPRSIDLLFIDSVRYTHLAILRACREWLQAETVIVMEDDIPGYGELAIVESEFALRGVKKYEIRGHPWPLVEFRIAR